MRILFAIIFMWTPPHFWALALVKNDDYSRANIPMLPVVAGATETCRQILIYTVLMASLVVMPTVIGMASLAFGVIAGIASILFIALSLKLWFKINDKNALQLFNYSILYLFLVFLGLVIDHFISGLVGA